LLGSTDTGNGRVGQKIGRTIEPQEAAAMAAFPASEQAAAITGQDDQRRRRRATGPINPDPVA